MGALGESRCAGIVSPAYGVYRPQKSGRFLQGYLDYLLRTPTYVSEYICRSTGIRSSRLRLYPDKFLSIPLLQPPVDEQRKIVSFLRAQDREIAKLIRCKRQLIDLLTEQKQAIIHRAVTAGLNKLNVSLKSSGIDWLGDVPAHWDVLRLKALTSNVVEQTYEKGIDELYVALEHVESWTGKLLHRSRKADFQSQVKRFQRSDILFGKLRPYLAKVLRPQEPGVCVGEFLVLRVHGDESTAAFLEEVLRSKEVISLVNSSTYGAKMPRAEWAFIGNVRIPMPPSEAERQEIIQHIHAESVRVDFAIKAASDEIDLILEHRNRLISDVVTGQIDVRSWQTPADEFVEDKDTAQAFAEIEGDEEAQEAKNDDQHE
jgi:type I restriction enzyme S subunit